MFAPPPRTTAQVVVRLSDALHHPPGDLPEWSKFQRPGVPAASFIEGPVFDTSGNLWFCDIPYGRLFRCSNHHDIEVAHQYAGEPNGLALGPDGCIYIADYSEGLLRFDPQTNERTTIIGKVAGSRFKGLNDLIFSTTGDLYFTDQGSSGLHDPTGRVYRLRPTGQLDLLLDNVPSPNGLALSPDEHTLFLAVTRDNAIWRVPLLPDGGVMKVGAFIRLSGGSGPDGLVMDPKGNLVVCHFGLGVVWVFNPSGEPIRRIDSPAGKLITNATFSMDGRSLFITESGTGSILRAEVDW